MNRRSSSEKPASARGCGRQFAGCLLLPFVIGALILVVWAAMVGLDALLVAPWGYSLFDRPTLAGHWVSTFTTPSGIRFGLYFELERAHDAGGGAVRHEAALTNAGFARDQNAAPGASSRIPHGLLKGIEFGLSTDGEGRNERDSTWNHRSKVSGGGSACQAYICEEASGSQSPYWVQ